ncbi:YggS family pyridoxal phosphate-dependent enzyme [Tenacibaculum finnmarkense genomovar finnmarkense]|uniref:YggS family pyridoxal phosphate-dependent enzyme n=1 Tax=Tenacibaculum finnmarkense TaxID=2781243 RepID=UPI001E433765|nr:YggS family pyridoxal phosphate-dependent enzyme [Tenacibaculum finnmarkense]MCD8418297.1 YggS family pyridoxal phosphate-dependent enzyme [Tenacibaculum finnmarkense genomovar finnmarkense]MCG8186670.1 YggS family pyridoxal phosphate-dependent enzyme [Tenacibaculum finnmarkense genomovar finnmarkense]MCG8203204.1 YggS family pyridoxal phosphate-dependent enzyme [Tenacibaculum finnmarkense genomovar finnmarkense]MCG8210577.1 YggS family pyridoxal phosphate-dependent enzyme [Tenacibaculum fin
MTGIKENLIEIKKTIPANVTLVAVSKTKPIADIQEAYNAGQRIFGENKIQEMAAKFDALPKDIEWHMIGHLQSNKVKYMAHFVNLIHGVDSFKTLKEINKQAKKHDRVINCLLQARIAKEETKFGLSFLDIDTIISSEELLALQNIKIVGFMGMATFTQNQEQLTDEFTALAHFFNQSKKQHIDLKTLSMGMSGDYQLAIKNGSTMVRIGSAIFGVRNYIV